MWSQPVARLSKRMNAVAAPTVIFGSRHHMGREGIQLHIPQAVVTVALVVEQDGAIALIPHRADSAVFSIEVPRVAKTDLLHRVRENTFVRWRDDHVVMRCHQRERMDANAMASRRPDD